VSDDTRRDRIARNEVLFREVNERVQEIAGGPESGTVLAVCECGRADCTKEITLSSEEYAELRSDPVAFAVLPDHVEPSVEYVVAEKDGYVVVRKMEDEAWRARLADGDNGT
jgi:hypothetical protein